jgi:hypothetical protein
VKQEQDVLKLPMIKDFLVYLLLLVFFDRGLELVQLDENFLDKV